MKVTVDTEELKKLANTISDLVDELKLLKQQRNEAREVAAKLADYCNVTCPTKYHDIIGKGLEWKYDEDDRKRLNISKD